MSKQVVVVKSNFGRVEIREKMYVKDKIEGLLVRIIPNKDVELDTDSGIVSTDIYMYRPIKKKGGSNE